jgi:hypothetical protein
VFLERAAAQVLANAVSVHEFQARGEISAASMAGDAQVSASATKTACLTRA